MPCTPMRRSSRRALTGGWKLEKVSTLSERGTQAIEAFGFSAPMDHENKDRAKMTGTPFSPAAEKRIKEAGQRCKETMMPPNSPVLFGDLPYGENARHTRFTSEDELNATLPPDRAQVIGLMQKYGGSSAQELEAMTAVRGARIADEDPQQVAERINKARKYANGFNGNHVILRKLLDFNPSSTCYVPIEHATSMVQNYIKAFGGWALDVGSGVIGVWKCDSDPSGDTARMSFKTAWHACGEERHQPSALGRTGPHRDGGDCSRKSQTHFELFVQVFPILTSTLCGDSN